MKFRFRLEPVLKLRKHKLNHEKQRLAVLIQEQSELQTQYAALELKVEEALSPAGTRRSAGRERLFQNYLLLEVQNLHRLKEKILAKSASIGRQRQRVTEADREVEKVEKLRQKAIVEYNSERQKEEQNLQNEIGTGIYHRNQML